MSYGAIAKGLLLVSLTTAAACVGSIGGDPGSSSDDDGPSTQGFTPPAPTMRRLLARQYVNSVRALLGDGAASAALPPSDEALAGFEAIGSAQNKIGLERVKIYEASARAAAAAAMTEPRVRDYIPCTPSGANDVACYTAFIQKFGRVAFRRPVNQEESADLLKVAQAASTQYETFDSGVEHVIATILQSPSFLYQVEVGQALPGAPGLKRLTSLELATRMSFFLADTTPTEALLDAADSGDLETLDGVKQAANALLSTDASKLAVRALYDESLGVREIGSVAKDPSLFPEFTPDLAQAMREETLQLVAHLYETDGDFRDFLSARYTFVNGDLAEFYGYETTGTDWQRVELPAEERRAGFLGHASFLASQAHRGETSPTLRGKFVVERLLCQGIKPPPPDVETVFPPDSGNTKREQLAVHQENESCAGCHKLLDGIGLSFENYDAVGRYREMENGIMLDASGEFGGTTFTDPGGFADLVSADPAFADCIVKNVFRQSLGHIETDGEKGVLTDLAGGFESNGFKLKELLVDLVASDAFRFVGVEQ